MKTLLSSRGLFMLGFLLLAATNGVVLFGVASNRSGEPEALLTLTERELDLSYHVYEDNSGLALRLSWRALGLENLSGYSGWRNPRWLNTQKLEELGFKVVDDRDRHGRAGYDRVLPKEVFIVLELGGEPYRKALKRAVKVYEREKDMIPDTLDDKGVGARMEQAERRLERERFEATRLFAIDAGLDAGALRRKYKDQRRYIITKGLVKPGYRHGSSTEEGLGYILRLSVEEIHVPLEHKQIFTSIPGEYGSRKSKMESLRYEVRLAYGQRLEPWIVSVKPRADTSP